ncbi:unnamed protein product [Urochloa humidicola]
MDRNFLDASLRPPAHDHQPPDEAGAPGSWAMLNVRAYIADRRNATTASCLMSNRGVIQVTFCVAPPPVVSYFCVWCPDPARLAEIGTEPRIIAAEADLAVLRVGFGPGFDCLDPRCQDIFVYHAGGGDKGPSLHLVTNEDDPYCLYFNTGILRHRNDSDPYDEYHIVAMGYTSLPWQFKLHLFDSKTGTWRSKRIPVQGREHQHRQFRHAPSKVIMLGEGGLMAFVDPWRGILVCDVLDCEDLHYIPFPRTLKENKKLRLNPVISRDIIVAQGRIKVVDCFYCSASDAWKGSVWSKAATSLEKNWDRDYTFEIRDSLVDTNTLHFELLPKLQADDDDSPSQKTLEALYISHPTLSLNDDHGVYFMGKPADLEDKRAWVLAVDLKNKRLQDVSLLDPVRTLDVSLTYIHSRISKYFQAAPR